MYTNNPRVTTDLPMLLITAMLMLAVEGAASQSGCPPGTFERVDMTCERCKQGMYSKEAGAKSPLACKNCAKGTYSIDSTSCAQCPINTISPPGAYDLLECTALPGYFGRAGKTGAECPANHYCTQGTSIPTQCPPGTISPPVSARCVPGIQSVEFLDWMFGIAWVILFSLGIAGLAVFKKVLLLHKAPPHGPDVHTIQIQITR